MKNQIDLGYSKRELDELARGASLADFLLIQEIPKEYVPSMKEEFVSRGITPKDYNFDYNGHSLFITRKTERGILQNA